MPHDPASTNDPNMNNIPGYQRTTSSIYNLIHSSNNNRLQTQEGNTEDTAAIHHARMNTDKSFNFIPQGQNFNSYYTGDTNNRPMLPSLSKTTTTSPQGRSLSQHSNIPIGGLTTYNRSASNENTLTNVASKETHDTPYYKQLNNLSRGPSNLTTFQTVPFIAEPPHAIRTQSPINPLPLNTPKDSQQNLVTLDENKNNEYQGKNKLPPFTNPQHTLNETTNYGYTESNNDKNIASTTKQPNNDSKNSSPTPTTGGNIQTTFAFKPTNTTTKSKVNNNLLASRRNTQELVAKSIAERYLDRPISEYASIVKEAELDVLHINPAIQTKSSIQALEQKKERERQVYALLWLMKNCESQHDSYVPRGRIFAQYASSCAQYNLKPLSQASLGKLIRTIFPGLTTRRLGMRGQSKYHYCGLRLIHSDGNDSLDEDMDTSSTNVTPPLSKPNSPEASTIKLEITETIPSLDEPDQKTDKDNHPKRKNEEVEHTIKGASTTKKNKTDKKKKNNKPETTVTNLETSSLSLQNVLPNIFKNEVVLSKLYKLSLPPIPKSSLSSNIDPDMISSLESLYHIHCNKIFDNIKFLRFESLATNLLFFHTGAVSPQMYNLLISEELNDWIAQCDRITHISLAKYLSNLVISVDKSSEAASETTKSLENFVETYPKQISDMTMELPAALRKSKTRTAKEFAALLRKLLKLGKFILKFLNSFEAFKGDMQRDWDAINLDDIYEMISTDKHHDVCKSIKDFLQENITLLFKEKPTTNNEESISLPGPVDTPFNTLILKFLEFVSGTTCSANTLINIYTRFTNALIGDISLKSSENLLLWLFFNNVTVQLLNYSYEATIFVTQ